MRDALHLALILISDRCEGAAMSSVNDLNNLMRMPEMMSLMLSGQWDSECVSCFLKTVFRFCCARGGPPRRNGSGIGVKLPLHRVDLKMRNAHDVGSVESSFGRTVGQCRSAR